MIPGWTVVTNRTLRSLCLGQQCTDWTLDALLDVQLHTVALELHIDEHVLYL